MATLAELGLECDLTGSPWRYPGPWPAGSGLLQANGFVALAPPTTRRPGGGPGEWLLASSGAAACGAGSRPMTLAAALARAAVAPLEDRVAVAAVGSNAAPAVLRTKLAAGGADGSVPYLRAVLHDVTLGHSAHASRAGFLPATPVHRRGARCEVYVLLLDRRQQACLDATEPNYRVRKVTADRCRLRLVTGGAPSAYYLYESLWGTLGPPSGPVTAFGRQHEVVAMLRDRWQAFPSVFGDDRDPRVLLARLAASERLRTAFRDRLHSSGWSRPSALP